MGILPPTQRRECSFGVHLAGTCIGVWLRPEMVNAGSADADININIVVDQSLIGFLVQVFVCDPKNVWHHEKVIRANLAMFFLVLLYNYNKKTLSILAIL